MSVKLRLRTMDYTVDWTTEQHTC